MVKKKNLWSLKSLKICWEMAPDRNMAMERHIWCGINRSNQRAGEEQYMSKRYTHAWQSTNPRVRHGGSSCRGAKWKKNRNIILGLHQRPSNPMVNMGRQDRVATKAFTDFRWKSHSTKSKTSEKLLNCLVGNLIPQKRGLATLAYIWLYKSLFQEKWQWKESEKKVALPCSLKIHWAKGRKSELRYTSASSWINLIPRSADITVSVIS